MDARSNRRCVAVDYQGHTWGTVAKVNDADGSLCSFKANEKFEGQVRDGWSWLTSWCWRGGLDPKAQWTVLESDFIEEEFAGLTF